MKGWGFRLQCCSPSCLGLKSRGAGFGTLGFINDFKSVPVLFVTLGLGSQILFFRAIFHGLGTQTPGVQTLRVQRTTP